LAAPPPQGTGPQSTGRLADEFFLMAHDDISGRTRLPDRITGLALAAALLGELALGEWIEVRSGAQGVLALPGGEPVWESGFDGAGRAGSGFGGSGGSGSRGSGPTDPLAARVFEYLAAEQHPVRTWLAFFAQNAHADVADRLIAAGLVSRRPRRRPWQPDCWVPTSPNVAALPAAQLVTRLIRGRPLSDQQTVLIGLLRATGLDQPVLWEVRQSAPDAARHLGEAIAALKPSLTELISQAEAAVGAAIASHRT
jgi:Golgi phosphoprotein 3 GPP34